ncbi:MAG: hypothetical protein HOA14_09490 [Planctomycetaceae bacterium]|nr:hypothetical protein [Planctomycetaceae bacterium]
MSQISFTCPYCKQTFVFPAEIAGQQSNCSNCNNPVVIVANSDLTAPQQSPYIAPSAGPQSQSPIQVDPNTEHTTIELTAKKYKKIMLIGFPLIILGILFFIAAAALSNTSESAATGVTILGGFLFVVGIGFYFYARVGAWWNHG